MPCVREDARAQAAAIKRQQTEEHAEDSNQDHAARAFIRVRAAEDHGGGQHAQPYAAARPAYELALQVAAKDNFLGEANQHAEQHPCGYFSSVRGRQLLERAQRFEFRRIVRK